MEPAKCINKVFQNQDPLIKPKGFCSFIKWRFTSSMRKWPKNVEVVKDHPPAAVCAPDMRISAVGHATFLIQLKNKNILTDPVWSKRVSPFSWIGPKRVSDVGIDFDRLPAIDIVLISHNHYDHLDLATLKRLQQQHKPIFITPLGNQVVIKKALPDACVYDLDWYQSVMAHELQIHVIPSQHWSSRWVIDTNKNLWGGFIIESAEGQICFIGDSGYSKPMFEEIGARFSKIVCAILPIGAYEPRWFMKDVHMNPEDALLAFLDLKADFFIPSHFGAFQLTDESYQQQLTDYAAAIAKLQIAGQRIVTLMPGQFTLREFASSAKQKLPGLSFAPDK
jgi:L-ascorbate metabolism protein UlaG (beta-lactamase superfamily)